jgi:hypothetical protein
MVLMMTDTRVMSIDELNAFLASSDVFTFKGNLREEIVGEGLCIASRSSVPRELRHMSTEAEKLLWQQELRARQLGGAKFRKQTPIGPYIVNTTRPKYGNTTASVPFGWRLKASGYAASGTTRC